MRLYWVDLFIPWMKSSRSYILRRRSETYNSCVQGFRKNVVVLLKLLSMMNKMFLVASMDGRLCEKNRLSRVVLVLWQVQTYHGCFRHKSVYWLSYPSVERRWPTGDRTLRYRRHEQPVYHDTMYRWLSSYVETRIARYMLPVLVCIESFQWIRNRTCIKWLKSS